MWDAGPTGLEPATSAVTGRRSNQTELQSHFNIKFVRQRGPKRDRTADLLNAIQALYQLSYSPGSEDQVRRVVLANGPRRGGGT